MSNQEKTLSEKMTDLLFEFKKKKIATSKIELDLKISSGYLWKVKEGKKTITQEKYEEILNYFKSRTGIDAPIDPDLTPVVKKKFKKENAAVFKHGYNREEKKENIEEKKVLVVEEKVFPKSDEQIKQENTNKEKKVMPSGLGLLEQIKWRIENGE